MMHGPLRWATALVAAATVAVASGNEPLPAGATARQTTNAERTPDLLTATSFVVVPARPPGAQAVPDCPVARLCLYEHPDFGYPRAQLDVSCGMTDLATWGWQRRTEAIDNRLGASPYGADSKSKEARAGEVVFVHRIGSGLRPNDLEVILRLDQRHRLVADLSGRDTPDYLYRYCG